MTESIQAKPQRPRRPATPPVLDIGDFASIVEEPLPLPLAFQMHRRESYPVIDDVDSKALPLPPPQSPISIEDETENSSSSSSSMSPQQAPMTKRQHALHELLSSERAYASDLALIREVHIPLALGQQVPLNIAIPSPPSSSSASSSRTVSTASDSSTGHLGPPMTPDDVRAIFSNITELAHFSDQFCDLLEEALGSVLDGGEGQDRVGALFLEIIPEMEKPYKYYINRHPAALAHLQSLPQTPALTDYMQRTQTVASNLSHAWDIASLLIKPVQRLLKYSLLLNAIIDETPDIHGDKENLKLARQSMEEVARNVNEGRRRAEVVKEVLTAKKKAPVNVGVAAQVNLTKMKSLSRYNKPADGEAAKVERLHAELKRIDAFAQQFAKGVLLTSMEEQEPFHYHLLTMNVSAKNRPPPALLAASNNYLALRGQLAAELPTYLTLLHKGLSHFVLQLAQIQASFWRDVRDRWAELWDMLRVEGEMNAGQQETLAVWQARWEDVNEEVMGLSILQTRKLYQEPMQRHETVVSPILASLEPHLAQPKQKVKGGSIVVNALGALDPHPQQKVVSPPQPLIPRGRSRGNSVTESVKESPTKPPRKKSDALMDFVAGLPSSRNKSPGHNDQPPHYTAHSHPPLPRTKSMPLYSTSTSSSSNLISHADRAISHRNSTSSSRHDADTSQEINVPVLDEDRGRTSRKPSIRRKFTDSIRPVTGHYRRRSTSKSAQDVLEDYDVLPTPQLPSNSTHSQPQPHPPQVQAPPQTRHIRDSWVTKPAKYLCCVVHECRPPVPVSYFSFPFFTLVEGELYEVLHEAGHPSIHSKLPLHVDDGEDCLLLCRDGTGDVGWALASFLAPIDAPTFN
ncbi:hypothetical protein H0H93_009141 [Arthromyces matolae]|nr:hypothetical protein H0H93_009141 [Arthromyces matolae]